MKRFKSLFIIAMLGTMLCASFSACNGILDGIYDEAEEDGADGIAEGSVYADVTSYTQWVCIDFHTQAMETIQIADDGSFTDPDDWDIALHRWDARTNGGAVLETNYTSLDDLLASGSMPAGTFVSDVWTTEQIIIDMSQMMSGVLGYAESYYNEELSKWIEVDTSSMPPSYALSGKVYILQLTDGTYVALQLSDYTNASGVKGYLTIDYVYPLEF